MERFQDPERLAALFARCRIPERLSLDTSVL